MTVLRIVIVILCFVRFYHAEEYCQGEIEMDPQYLWLRAYYKRMVCSGQTKSSKVCSISRVLDSNQTVASVNCPPKNKEVRCETAVSNTSGSSCQYFKDSKTKKLTQFCCCYGKDCYWSADRLEYEQQSLHEFTVDPEAAIWLLITIIINIITGVLFYDDLGEAIKFIYATHLGKSILKFRNSRRNMLELMEEKLIMWNVRTRSATKTVTLLTLSKREFDVIDVNNGTNDQMMQQLQQRQEYRISEAMAKCKIRSERLLWQEWCNVALLMQVNQLQWRTRDRMEAQSHLANLPHVHVDLAKTDLGNFDGNCNKAHHWRRQKDRHHGRGSEPETGLHPGVSVQWSGVTIPESTADAFTERNTPLLSARFNKLPSVAQGQKSAMLCDAVLFIQCVYKIMTIVIRDTVKYFLPFIFVSRKSVAGETVLITGSGSGIGRKLAERFATFGTRLVLWDINESANAETKRIVENMGAEAFTYRVDLSIRDEIYWTAEQVKREVGDVNIVINNAGIVFGKRIMDSSDDEIQKTMHVNILSHFFITKAFLGSMMKSNHGHIIEIASMAGKCGVASLADYCASKHAVLGFASSLIAELRSKKLFGVHVTTICPFFINTGMFEGVRSNSRIILPMLSTEYVVDGIIEAVLTNKEIVYLPKFCKLLVFLQCVLPTDAFHVLEDYNQCDRYMAHFKGRRTV